jgi:hypothetical protein
MNIKREDVDTGPINFLPRSSQARKLPPIRAISFARLAQNQCPTAGPSCPHVTVSATSAYRG